MGEAAIIAFTEMAKACFEMVTEIVRGQPVDVKKQLWEWHVEDMKRWRELLGLDKPTNKATGGVDK